MDHLGAPMDPYTIYMALETSVAAHISNLYTVIVAYTQDPL